MPHLRPRPAAYPGFGLAMGCTLFYLSLIVLLPLSALLARAASLSWSELWAAATEPRVLAAYRLSFGASSAAAGVSGVLGVIVAWCLQRYRFPGRRLIDALVDLPFALPTAVAGIALSTLYAPTGPFGRLLGRIGVEAAFTPLGVVAALSFIGLPFVVRALQPALADLDRETEEAAASLGASRLQVARRIIAPAAAPAWITGVALAFARGLGEYGSVIFIAGNMPMRTEIAPLLIVAKLEQFDYDGATAIAAVMLAASLAALLGINALHRWAGRRLGREAA